MLYRGPLKVVSPDQLPTFDSQTPSTRLLMKLWQVNAEHAEVPLVVVKINPFGIFSISRRK